MLPKAHVETLRGHLEQARDTANTIYRVLHVAHRTTNHHWISVHAAAVHTTHTIHTTAS